MYRSAGLIGGFWLLAVGAAVAAGGGGRAPAMGSATGLSPIRPMVGSARGLSPIRPVVGSGFHPSPSRFRLERPGRAGITARFAHRNRIVGGGDLAYAGLALDTVPPTPSGPPEALVDPSGGDAPILSAPPPCVRPLIIHVGRSVRIEHTMPRHPRVRVVYGRPPCGVY